MNEGSKWRLQKPYVEITRETAGDGYPLLLCLTGGAEVPHWNQEVHPCFLWTVLLSDGLDHIDIAEMAEQLIEKYPIDATRIYAVGAGEAADIVWEMLGAYPDLFSGVVVSGGAGQIWKVRRASFTPMWVLGREDDSHCAATGQIWTKEGKALHGSLTLARTLRMAGNENVLYTDGPEKTAEQLVEDEEKMSWLFTRSRKEGYRIEMLRPGVWHLEDYSGSSFYVVEGTKTALVIDTGLGTEAVTPWIRRVTGLPLSLALTHAHGDHMFHADEFKTVYLNYKDKEILPRMKETMLAGRSIDYEGLQDIPDGSMIDLGGVGVEVMEVPGHTPGSVIFIDHTHKVIFTGDAIGSGQMVLLQLEPVISLKEYKANLQRLYDRLTELDDYVLLGGHITQEGGYPFGTTYNPSPYNPLGKEVVQDMMELCDLFGTDKVEKEEKEPDRLCSDISYLGYYGKAGLCARKEQFEG